MACAGWPVRDPVALLQMLETDAAKADFFMIVRLLENAHPALPRVGTSLRPRDDAVRFSQNPELVFHPTAIDSFMPATGRRRARLAVNFFGLTGANGPLPLHLTEYARDRLRNANDPTFARFLDIFHHRLLSLFYRARAVGEPTTNLDRQDDDRFSRYVGTLAGIGAPSLRERDSVPDFAKLHFAGLLASHTRPASGLASILRAFFGVPASVQQFVGHWLPLPPEVRTRLGVRDGSSALGLGAVLGAKVWDTQGKFRIVLGPLDYPQYCALLPGGDSISRLVDWVRNYVGDALEWDVQLILKQAEVPPLKLGASQLGWTSWTNSLPAQCDAGQIRLNPVALARPRHA